MYRIFMRTLDVTVFFLRSHRILIYSDLLKSNENDSSFEFVYIRRKDN